VDLMRLLRYVVAMTGWLLYGSSLTQPLEPLALWAAFVMIGGGVAGAAALISGRTGREIADESAKGAAAGFILGFFAAISAAMYLVLSA
jgi:hypothetical protein